MPTPSIPGPASLVPGKWFVDLMRDPLSFFPKMQRTYGDIVRFTFGRHEFFMVNHPDWMEEVLVTSKKFGRGTPARRLFGDGMISLNGQEHLKQRRTVQPLFHRRYVHGFAAVMVRQAELWRDRLTADKTLDMNGEMRDLTLSVVCDTLFYSDDHSKGAEVGEAWLKSTEHFGVGFIPGIDYVEKLPLPYFVRIRRARAQLERALNDVIADRRASGDHPDLISMLMAARDPDNPTEPGMTDKQIRDEAMGVFVGGYETTANSMAWTWHLLAKSPEVEARLHDELERVLSGRVPTPEDVPKLEYARAVVAESMRLFPPVWTLGRKVLEPYTLGGHALDVGTVVWTSQWVAHRDPRWWDAPDVFRPERWMDANAPSRPKYSYFPFGGGVHQCVGEGFAWTEATLLLATIGQQWRFETVSEPTPEARLTLRPKGLRMRAIRRAATA